jgi:hypothetical protein
MSKYLYLSVLYLLVSCANPKKLHRMMDKIPDATAKECADRYPIRETIDTVAMVDSALLLDYQLEFMRLSIMIDNLLSDGCDTVVRERIIEVLKNIPCKPQTKIITKTQESTAKLQVLKNDCDKTIKSLSQINTENGTKIHKLELKNGKLKSRVTWMWFLIVCLFIFSFRSQIAKMLIR